ncbi:hypothetical protein Dimus_005851, partial [Dionaea muscipula]
GGAARSFLLLLARRRSMVAARHCMGKAESRCSLNTPTARWPSMLLLAGREADSAPAARRGCARCSEEEGRPPVPAARARRRRGPPRGCSLHEEEAEQPLLAIRDPLLAGYVCHSHGYVRDRPLVHNGYAWPCTRH